MFEYLSRGKPVITSRAPGVRDYFDDDALFFFELGDAEDLAHRWSAERTGLVNRIAELLS